MRESLTIELYTKFSSHFSSQISPQKAELKKEKGGTTWSDFGEENQEEIVGSKLENHLPSSRGKSS